MKKTVGQLLQEKKIITVEQLAECKEHASTGEYTVEKCLIEKKYASAEDVAKALAEYVAWPYIAKITDGMADPMLLATVPLRFLRDNGVIPVKIDDGLMILTASPIDYQPLDELNLLLEGQASFGVSTEKVIIDAINKYYPIEGAKQMIAEFEKEEDKDLEGSLDFDDIEETDIVAMAAEAPIIKLVNNILYQAVKRDASDIHIEPFEKEIQVRYRIDGVLYTVMTPPKRIQNALVSRIKIMANLDIAEKRIPQDGRIDIKVAGKPWDIRVSILPVAFGERIVMRLLDKAKTFGKLERLGFSERDFKLITQSIAKPNGIIYITGPTGSGKTSTLYSILSELNRPEVNIVTVEDPVEYQMSGIGQVQVRSKVGLTFAAALRSILRQDPDIIMIGETRDFETAQIAIQSALTGHLVLSTLHTNSAPSTITRLLDMGLEPFLISSSLVLAMAQRLVRKLCDYCKKPYQPPLDVLQSIGLTAEQAKGITFYEPIGCEECNLTGFKGRLAIFELMEVTSGIVKLIMDRADTSLIQKQAIKDGMTLLVQDGLRKVKEGLTTIEEVLSAAAIEQEMVE